MLADDLNASDLIAFHDRALTEWAGSNGVPEPRFNYGLWHWVEGNHWCNAQLWLQEERERNSVTEGETREARMSIDRYRQERWDAVRRIDQALPDVRFILEHAVDRVPEESVGAMVDRLSLLAVQIFHTARQSLRRDASEAYVARCTKELEGLIEERAERSNALDRLLREAQASPDYIKVYRRVREETPGLPS